MLDGDDLRVGSEEPNAPGIAAPRAGVVRAGVVIAAPRAGVVVRRVSRLTAARIAMVAAGTLIALLCPSAPALATRDHVFGSAFGEKGAGAGQLEAPKGVAVNEETGDVYVVDSGNDRVEYFTPDGGYVGEFNGSGSDHAVEGKAAPTGRFAEPEAIAIDNDPGSPSYGDVYVADVGHEVIDKFSASGAYLGQLTEASAGAPFGRILGVAVDSQGLLWVEQENKQIDSFSASLDNEFLKSVEIDEFFRPLPGFAVDSSGDFYIKLYFEGVAKLNSSGEELVEEFDGEILRQPDSNVVPGSMAVDLADNEVYVSNADGKGSVGRFTAQDAVVEEFGSEHLSAGSGIAINSSTGAVYVAEEGGDSIVAFGLEPEARPTIESEAPAAVTGSSATLEAQIKPTGPDTTYYFQYGAGECNASPSICTDVPEPPGVEIGEGFSSQSVNVHLQGLQAATTYRFRVVAVNALGTSYGPEQSFTTQAVGSEFALPDGRVWEMVTPVEKHGAGLAAVGNEQGADIQAAENGDAITYGATAPFATNPAGSRSLEITQVFSTRTAPGIWSTQDITTAHDEGPTGLAIGSAAEYKLFSSNLSLGLVEPQGDTPLPPQPADAERTMYLRTASGEYVPLVTAANVPPGTKFGGESGAIGGGVSFITGTPDLSHIILESGVQLTSTPLGEAGSYLYEWSGGHLQLASVLPDGAPTPASLGDRGDRIAGDVRQAISQDGSRVVFEAEHHDYLRDMATGETVQIDAAQGAPEPPNGASVYSTADSSDSRIFFTSHERLTSDATTRPKESEAADLYEFEVTSGTGQPLAGRLNDLSVDANPGESADVLGVGAIGASEDGSYVYFVANGVLGDGGARGAKPGDCERTLEPFRQTCSLYVVHYDANAQQWEQPRYIATLSGADSPSWGARSEDLSDLFARVSPNGLYLAFMSDRSLTGYDNRDAVSGAADEEVYLYDAASERLVCASCNPTGARPKGAEFTGVAYENLVLYGSDAWSGQWLASNVPGWTSKDLDNAIYQSRYLSNNGRLFFDSDDALVPADVNGQEDVYEYEPSGLGSCQAPGYGQSASDVYDASAGGCVGLISAGTSPEESAFMDASEGGGDVFFITASRLSPQDVDTSYDLYDAHECTAAAPCAPPVASTPPPCTTGDACKPAPTPQPTVFGAPSSETFSGAGNLAPAETASSAAAKSTKGRRKRAKASRGCAKKRGKRRTACVKKAKKGAHRAKLSRGDGQAAGAGRVGRLK